MPLRRAPSSLFIRAHAKGVRQARRMRDAHMRVTTRRHDAYDFRFAAAACFFFSRFAASHYFFTDARFSIFAFHYAFSFFAISFDAITTLLFDFFIFISISTLFH